MKTIEQVRKDGNPFHAMLANHCWNACLKVGIDPHGMTARDKTAFAKKTTFEEIVAVEMYDLSGKYIYM